MLVNQMEIHQFIWIWKHLGFTKLSSPFEEQLGSLLAKMPSETSSSFAV